MTDDLIARLRDQWLEEAAQCMKDAKQFRANARLEDEGVMICRATSFRKCAEDIVLALEATASRPQLSEKKEDLVTRVDGERLPEGQELPRSSQRGDSDKYR